MGQLTEDNVGISSNGVCESGNVIVQSGLPESCNEGHVARPSIILWIGIIDVLASLFYTGLTVFTLVGLNNSDLDEYIWDSLGFLGALLRLLMGIGLIIGFTSEDDAVPRRYCKLWIAGQLIFWVVSVFEVTSAIFAFIITPLRNRELSHLVLAVGIFFYRIVSSILVWLFYRQLKPSECTDDVTEPDDHEQQEENHAGRLGNGESLLRSSVRGYGCNYV